MEANTHSKMTQLLEQVRDDAIAAGERQYRPGGQRVRPRGTSAKPPAVRGWNSWHSSGHS